MCESFLILECIGRVYASKWRHQDGEHVQSQGSRKAEELDIDDGRGDGEQRSRKAKKDRRRKGRKTEERLAKGRPK